MDGLLLISGLWHSRPLLFDVNLDFMLGKVTVTKYTATGKSTDDNINHRLMPNSHPKIVYLHGKLEELWAIVLLPQFNPDELRGRKQGNSVSHD